MTADDLRDDSDCMGGGKLTRRANDKWQLERVCSQTQVFQLRCFNEYTRQILMFYWPWISVYLSHNLANLMHKICFTISFISCLYMFRARVLIIRRSKLHYTASGISQLDAQNLFHEKFYFMPLHVSSTCAHQQEVKIASHKLWYH